jgi:ABC-type long-subunit fatty acid transport system fused permease/ATPase subunit
MLGAGFILKPFAKTPPCVVCGRVNTKPVITLFQYRQGVIPFVREVTLWYCQRHIKRAPQIVTKLPTRFDKVWGRFRIVVITGLFTLVAFFFILVLLEMPISWLYLHPLMVLLAFIGGGITSNFTLTFFIASTALLPGIMYFIWHQWIFRRKL